MDTLLKDMDHAAGEDGRPVTITGTQAVIQRLLIRLGVRRGAFAPDPELGSELHKLPLALGGEARDRLALHFAQAALLPENARVEQARCRPVKGQSDALAVSVTVRVGDQYFPLEVSI